MSFGSCVIGGGGVMASASSGWCCGDVGCRCRRAVGVRGWLGSLSPGISILGVLVGNGVWWLLLVWLGGIGACV